MSQLNCSLVISLVVCTIFYHIQLEFQIIIGLFKQNHSSNESHHCFELIDSSTCSDEESDSVRLYNEVTGVKEDGLVQICKSGRWYSVCGSNWDCRDGNVACRELGYDQASKPYN